MKNILLSTLGCALLNLPYSPLWAIDVQAVRMKVDSSSISLLNGHSVPMSNCLFGLYLDRADAPIALSYSDSDASQNVISKLYTTDYSMACGLGLDGLTLMINAPFHIVQGYSPISGENKSSKYGLGDIEFTAKYALYKNTESDLTLAVAPYFVSPKGKGFNVLDEKLALLGEDTSAGGLTLIADKKWEQHQLVSNLSYHHRKTADFFNLHIGPEWRFGLAYGYRFDAKTKSDIFTEFLARDLVREKIGADRFSSYREQLVGVSTGIVEGFKFKAGSGLGLSEGYGSPKFRLFAGLEIDIKENTQAVITAVTSDFRTPAIKVKVVDHQDSSIDAKIVLFSLADNKQLDETLGRQAFFGPLKPGPYLVVATAEGKAMNQIRVDVQDPQKVYEHTLMLQDERQLSIRAVGEGGKPIETPVAYEITSRDPSDGFKLTGEISNQDEAKIPHMPQGVFRIRATAANYKEASEVFLVSANEKSIVVLSLKDKSIAIRSLFDFGDIKFKTGSATLAKESFEKLDRIVAFLQANSSIRMLSVEGHTDNKGSHKLNTKLSNDRAASVAAYLEGKGIQKSRLSRIGYGPDRPLTGNESEEGRTMNRRVEFVVTSIEAGPEKAP